MADFGTGLVSGIAGGMAIGKTYSDAWDDDAVDQAARARAEKVDSEPTAPEADAQPAPAEKAPEKKPQWAIGEGKYRKVFDTEPTADDIRQWRYDTIVQTAGAKHANDWMQGEVQRESAQRAVERDKIATEQARLLDGDSKELRELQKTQEENERFADEVMASGGTVDGYINATAGDPAALSPEQRKVISDRVGLALDPTSRYRTMLKQANIVRRTNPDKAAELVKTATKQAAGEFISALEQEDAGAVKSLYNIFPNGHLVQSVRFQNGNVVATDTSGRQIVKPKRDLAIMAQAYADPDKAMSTMNADERLAEQARKNADILAIQEQRLRLAQEKAGHGNGSGGGSRAGSGDSGAEGDIDLQKIGGNLKVFGDDPVANVELMSVARNKFLPHTAGSSQARGEEALRGAFVYQQRKAEATKALQEEKGEDYRPTAEELDNLVAPVGIDMATGQAVRKLTADPADPSSPSFVLGKPVSPAAPLPVQQITFGKVAGLPAMISAIKAGQLGDDDKAAWDRMLVAKVSNLPSEQQQEILQRWGAAGLVQHVTKYVKPDVQKDVNKDGKPGGQPGGVPSSQQQAASTPRSERDTATFGARPMGLGEAVSYAAGKVKDAVMPVVDHAREQHQKQQLADLNRLRQRNMLSDSSVELFKELLLKYPDEAEKYGFKRGTTELAGSAEQIATR